MGSSQSTAASTVASDRENWLYRKYNISKGKEGYGVLMVGETDSLGGQSYVDVSENASKMQEALKSCRIEVLSIPSTKQYYDHLCRTLCTNDMVKNLSQYCSYFFHFCGQANERGVVTSEGQNIPYHDIINKFQPYITHSNKPVVFLFDGHYITDIKARDILHVLISNVHQSLLTNTLICVATSLTYDTHQPGGMFSKELSCLLKPYRHLSFSDLIVMAGDRMKLANEDADYCICNNLTSQLIMLPEHVHPLMGEARYWIDHCCKLLRQAGSMQLTPSPATPTPGVGRKVFLVYTDDACGRCGQDLSKVWFIARLLTSLGYDVYMDGCYGDKDWYMWYATHITVCENVLLVCSPIVAEEWTRPQSEALPPHARSQSSLSSGSSIPGPTYSSSYSSVPGPSSVPLTCFATLITGVYERVQPSETHLQVHPIVLCDSYNTSHVPLLFSGMPLLRNFNDIRRQFNPLVATSDFDKLVFNLSRLHLPNSGMGMGPVRILGDKQGPGMYISPDIADLYAEKPGYKSVTHPIGPRPSFQMPSYELPSPAPTISTAPIPPTVPVPLSTVPVPPHKPASPMPALPNKPVQTKAFLWLQSRIVEWKWVGRYLGIKDTDLIRIERENPGELAEQCYQMFDTWSRQSGDTSYVVLYKALQEGERNDICKEFADFVNFELEV